MPKVATCAAVFLILTTGSAAAEDLEELAREGYGVIATTYVAGTYEGCDFDRLLKLDNGLIFECQSYNYHYAYHPEMLILKNVSSGSIKVLIDGEEVTGTFLRR